MQINSAEKVCMTADKWQDSPLPCGLEPKDFDYLDPNNKFWRYLYALASAEPSTCRSAAIRHLFAYIHPFGEQGAGN
jgi:hypothetical protein